MFCLLYKPGWLGTYYVDQVGLELSEICLPVSLQAAGIKGVGKVQRLVGNKF